MLASLFGFDIASLVADSQSTGCISADDIATSRLAGSIRSALEDSLLVTSVVTDIYFSLDELGFSQVRDGLSGSQSRVYEALCMDVFEDKTKDMLPLV
jgi:hypothetical protein